MGDMFLRAALQSIYLKVQGLKEPTVSDLPILDRYKKKVERLEILRRDMRPGRRGETGRIISRLLHLIQKKRFEADPPREGNPF